MPVWSGGWTHTTCTSQFDPCTMWILGINQVIRFDGKHPPTGPSHCLKLFFFFSCAEKMSHSIRIRTGTGS